MNNETQKLLVLELLDTLLGSWWTVVAGVCLGASAAILVVNDTRRTYAATAVIEADVDKLPEEFVRRTVSDDPKPQLPKLRSAVLSPDNMKVVIQQAFGTPRDDNQFAELAAGIT